MRRTNICCVSVFELFKTDPASPMSTQLCLVFLVQSKSKFILNLKEIDLMFSVNSDFLKSRIQSVPTNLHHNINKLSFRDRLKRYYMFFISYLGIGTLPDSLKLISKRCQPGPIILCCMIPLIMFGWYSFR